MYARVVVGTNSIGACLAFVFFLNGNAEAPSIDYEVGSNVTISENNRQTVKAGNALCSAPPRLSHSGRHYSKLVKSSTI